MSDKNITKFFAFVILSAAVAAIFSGCQKVVTGDRQPQNRDGKFSTLYEKPQTIGRLASSEITESSGLAASVCQANVFWTHNDSGGANEIFAFDARGAHLGKWRVANAKNVDWEDLAIFKNANGECFLYVGDIGNNSRKRGELIIYRVREPQISSAGAKSARVLTTEAAEAIKFVYPESSHDAETLLVHPQSGDIYVLSKRLNGAAAVYKLESDFSLSKTNTLEKIADFSVPAIPNGLLTGGSVAPDGKRVVVCDYFNAYEITVPDAAKNFDEIWSQKPATIELAARELGEAIAYAPDGKTIYATSEIKNAPFIAVRQK